MTQMTSRNSALLQDPSQWVDQFADRLYRYALLRLRDTHAAEEVVQETFLTAVERQQQFRGDGAIEGWLLTILKRKIVDWIRAQQRDRRGQERLVELGGWFDENGQLLPGRLPDVEPGAPVEASELWNIVRQCLQRLPDKLADVFVLHAMEDLSSEEICKELGITTSNLWVRMHRARLQLAECVAEKWGG